MMAGLWVTALDGYLWRDDLRPAFGEGSLMIDDPPPGERWLVPAGLGGRLYPFLNRPSLGREFYRLSLDPTDAEIARFAGKFGFLGKGTLLVSRGKGPLKSFTIGGDSQDLGESRSDWITELVDFRDLWETWQDASTLLGADFEPEHKVGEARRRLAERFHWDDDGSFRYDSRVEGSLFGWKEWHRWIAAPMMSDFDILKKNVPSGDLAAAGRFYVHREINDRLRQHINAHILPFRASVLRFVPDSLLSAIYLRFALEISGGMGRMRECLGCGREFPPSRRDQNYCGKNCRERASYRRRTGRVGSERDLRNDLSVGLGS